jgi:hypothetical protein
VFGARGEPAGGVEAGWLGVLISAAVQDVGAEARLTEAVRRGGTICVPVGAIAQAWRSSRQVRLARLLKSRDIDVAVMTPNVARSVGLLCARSGHDDVIDVHVALCARERGHAVITSDPGDISRVDPALPVIRA